jgi:hypothetical protein
VRIIGVDFTSAPRKTKPITVAHGELRTGTLRVLAIEPLYDFAAFEALLARPGPWTGGFDFPFGLPLELVRDLGWPRDWKRLVGYCRGLTRAALRASFDAYRATRPAGAKYPHRATDRPAGSSSPMKLVNPPVALMFHEGAPRLAAAGVHVPGLADGDRRRVALEAYPGMLARAVTRASYKSDSRSLQTLAREAARREIVAALERGRHALKTSVSFDTRTMRRQLLDDASGDSLDAVLCAVQVGWAAARAGWGLPRHIPRCEGWIASAVA